MNLLKKLSVVIVALGGMSVAQAGVIYRWYELEPNPNTGTINAFISIDSNYWAPGGSLQASGTGINSYFGIEKIFLESELGFTDPLDIWAQPCIDSDCQFAGVGLGELSFGGFSDTYDFDLHFGPHLTGFVYANDTFTDFSMGSNSLTWTIDQIASDSPGGCSQSINDCSGGTGLWLLDLTTIPEPGTLALLGLGLAGFGMNRRRKKT